MAGNNNGGLMAARDNNANLVGWGIGLVVAYLGFKKLVIPYTSHNVVKAAQTANYISRLRVVITGVKFTGKDLMFHMNIENPNDKPIQIKSVVGDVFAESNKGKTVVKIGHIFKYGFVVVKPNNQTSLPFSITLKILNTISFLSRMLNGDVRGIVFRLVGTINIDGTDYPINKTFLIA